MFRLVLPICAIVIESLRWNNKCWGSEAEAEIALLAPFGQSSDEGLGFLS